jgi:hypothetical protein
MRRMILLVGLFAWVPQAHAYIDPNAGGLLFQLLFPLLAAVAAMWAAFRSHLRSMFRRLADALRRRSSK